MTHTDSETSTYFVKITLSTTEGELPVDSEVEELIVDQLEGELDETTGLFCTAVDLIGRLADE